MDDRLEAAIGEALARGRAAWPALAVDDARFAAVVAHAVEGTPEPAAAVAELAAEDIYLAQACVGGSPAALDAFAATCDAALHGSLRAMGLAADLIEEVVQEVRAKLFVAADGPPRIATYSGRAALRSWVRTIATRAAVDRLRKKEDTTSDDAVLEALPDSGADPELAHFRRTYQAEFKQAFEEALATLDVRERNVLRHHFVDALTVEEIGAIYGVHKSTAFRWLEAARTALSKRTRAGFQQRIRALPGELDSILRLLQSQIDLSLSRVLG
jgi:RNA polymerase sigma-70 factor (ECF subfamily)